MADLKLQVQMSTIDKLTGPMKRMISSCDTLRTRTSQAVTELNKIKKLKTQTDALSKLGQSSKQTASKLSAAQAKTKSLLQEIKKTPHSTDKMRAAFDRARQAEQKLSQQHLNERQNIAALRSKLANAGLSTNNLTQANQKLEQSIKRANNRIETQSKILDRSRRAKSKYDQTMKAQQKYAIAGSVAMYGGTRVLGTMASMAQPGLEFDKSMSSVGAVTRLSKESKEYKLLSQQAQELGAKTAFTAGEAAQGMKYLAMAGFKANQITGAMPGILSLASASTMDLGETADIASNIISGFGIKASKMGDIGDVLSSTFTRSNVSLSELGETMKYVAPAAAAVGGTLEEVSAMAGKLGDAGIKGSDAGTAMRKIYTRLAGDKGAIDTLSSIGIKTKDANGKLRQMPDILKEIYEKTKKMGDADRLALLTKVSGLTAVSALSILTKQAGEGELQALQKTLELATVFNQIKDRLNDDKSGAVEQFQKLGVALYDNEGKLKESSQLMLEATEKTKGMSEAARKATLIKIAGKEVGTELSINMKSGGIEAVKKYVKTVQEAQNATKKMADAQLDNAAGDITLLSSAWDGLNISLMQTNNSPIRSLIQSLTGLITSTQQWVKDNPKLAGSILKIVGAMAGFIAAGGALALTISALLGPFAMFRYALMMIGVKSAASGNIFKWLGTTIFKSSKFIGMAFFNVGKSFGVMIIKIVQSVMALIGVFMKMGLAMLTNPMFLIIATIILAVAGLAYVIYKNWDAIKNYTSQAWNAIAGYFLGVWNEIKTAFDGGLTGVGALILNWSPLGLFYKAFAGVMNYFGVDMPKNFTDFGGDIINGLINGITNSVGTVKDKICSIGSSVASWFKETLGINSPSTIFTEFGGFLMSGLVNGIENMASVVKDKITNMGSSIIGWFKEKLDIHSPSRVFANLGGYIPAGVADGVEQQTPQAVNSIGKMAKKLPKILPATTLAIGLSASGTAMATSPINASIAGPSTIQSQGQPQNTHSSVINITINAPAGMDAQALAKAVAQELDQRQRRIQSRHNSKMYD